MTSTVLTNIGELVTNDPRRHDLLGIVEDAALVVDGANGRLGRPGHRGPGRRRAGRPRVAGPCSRASSTATATWSSPATGRRSSRPGWRGRAYAAGGIRTTVAATRAATDEQLTSHVARLVAEMRRQGTTTVEIKSGYGLTDERRGPRPRGRPAVHRRDDVPRRPRRARRQRPRGVRRPGDRADAGGGGAARPLDRRLLRAGRLRRRPGPPDPRGRRGRRARGPAARQPARARRRASGWPPSSACTAVDHCTYLEDADVDALRDSGTIATLLPGVEFSTKQPYPDARRLLDAGVRVAIASDCNPGSCFTSSVPLCVALAVREMGMTPAEAVHAATQRGAEALGRDDVGALVAGPAGRPDGARRPHPRPPRLPARRTARRRHVEGRPPGLTV